MKYQIDIYIDEHSSPSAPPETILLRSEFYETPEQVTEAMPRISKENDETYFRPYEISEEHYQKYKYLNNKK